MDFATSERSKLLGLVTTRQAKAGRTGTFSLDSIHFGEAEKAASGLLPKLLPEPPSHLLQFSS